ncbi:UNVERIFIED_CONTAM: hypothetical protein Slati_3483000 [Sesamum latifolium]|uniref:Pectinesterase inhibitor domain-containing protein n=1 Tax=Sesamum latifolium TaxID=2727402 RepID=A0AAW2UGL5_9LAMI
MKSMHDAGPKTSLLGEEADAALSSFRRRNKILILVFLLFSVCITVVIAVLIIYLVRNKSSMSGKSNLFNPALQAFCFVAYNRASCINTFNPIISGKSVSDPNQIFTLSLQHAIKELENVIPLVQSNTVRIRDGNDQTVAAFKNCSTSLLDALSRIRDAVGRMRANPFVEAQSDEERAEMVSRITAVEENLGSCIEDLATVEATDVREVRAKVFDVKAYVNSGGDFLSGSTRFFRRTGVIVLLIGV